MADLSTFVAPTYVSIPDRAGSYGSEAVDLCKLGGWTFDPEQEYALDVIMSHDSQGAWVGKEACMICARQNGKTNRVLIPRALWQLFLGPKDDVIWTAHRGVTSSQAFRDIKEFLTGTYQFRKRIKSISESYGRETITLLDGRMIKFLARSESGGRGLGGPLPVLDEAFSIEEGQLGALLPTVLARRDAQILYGSSAGLSMSSVLRQLRDRGRSGNDPSLIYVEWCAPGSWDDTGCQLEKCDHHRSRPGCSLDNESYLESANFALDRRIDRITVRTLRKALSPSQFGREILTWWDADPGEEKLLPMTSADWELCEDEDSQIPDAASIVITVDVSPKMEYSSIGIGGWRKDGLPHLELAKYAEGIEWVVPEIMRLKSLYKLHRINVAQGKDRDRPHHKRLVPAIILDPSGPASALLPDLQKKRVIPVMLNARDIGVAFGTLADDVKNHIMRHIGQPQLELALAGAVRRNIGDGQWGVARSKSADGSTDIAPMNVYAMARWGLKVAEPPPKADGPNVYIL